RTQSAPVTLTATARAVHLPAGGNTDAMSASALAIYDMLPTCSSNATVAALASLAFQAAIEHLNPAAAAATAAAAAGSPQLHVTTTFVFVFAATRGRLSAEDIASANAVLDYAYQHHHQERHHQLQRRCVVIINRIEADEMTEAEGRDYVETTRHVVVSSLHCERVDVAFLPLQPRPVDFTTGPGSPFSFLLTLVDNAAIRADVLAPPRPSRFGTLPLLLCTADLAAAIDATRDTLAQRREQFAAELAAMDAAARAAMDAERRRREAELDAMMSRVQRAAYAAPQIIIVQEERRRKWYDIFL
ncbi:MAG: hypothetical protein Q8J97_16150, partial [Flavobacteriaceae bacterium]|nr:hypothetical protein [Flavobacteriaceae bacterium]